jgi:flagellar biosynthesis/type III secretory pathway chaperone
MENGSSQNSLNEKLHESLQELIGLHRQLYEVVKAENEAVTNADLKATYDAAANKEALVHWIHQAEMSRQAVTYTLAQAENLETTTPSLRELILHFQSSNPDYSNQLQVDLTSLVVLVDRIKKQNELNGRLVEASLKHVNNMKRNIFGETTHQARTYNQQGQKNTASANEHGPRLISKEV